MTFIGPLDLLGIQIADYSLSVVATGQINAVGLFGSVFRKVFPFVKPLQERWLM